MAIIQKSYNKELKITINYIYLFGLVLLPIVLILLPAGFFDNGESVCLSVRFFKLTCYGCGITRAVQHLIHLDFEVAYTYNKLSVLVLPVLLFVWAGEIKRIVFIFKKNKKVEQNHTRS